MGISTTKFLKRLNVMPMQPSTYDTPFPPPPSKHHSKPLNSCLLFTNNRGISLSLRIEWQLSFTSPLAPALRSLGIALDFLRLLCFQASLTFLVLLVEHVPRDEETD